MKEKIENSKDMSDFWNALGNFRPRKQVNGKNVTNEEWVAHFSKLLGGTEEKQREGENVQREKYRVSPESPEITEFALNREISVVEVRNILIKLRKN